ncbi:MAG: hypothetical protein E6K40_15000 [Gammaproteobacteria bacterium]|nr:MAG: hypothetical protein E6K40_15000 [Gammaproteobacteria bacterium]
MKLPILIIGAGGHAAVVADALLAAGERVLGFTNTDTARHDRVVCGLHVLGDDRVLDAHTPDTLTLANGLGGVGSVAARLTMQQRLQARGWRFVDVRHPAALVSRFALVHDGAQLLAASVVDVAIGARSHIGAGAIVRQGIRLGEETVVGAGAVVVRDFAGGGLLIGVPAYPVEHDL